MADEIEGVAGQSDRSLDSWDKSCTNHSATTSQVLGLTNELAM
jgi:hypothetical protein